MWNTAHWSLGLFSMHCTPLSVVILAHGSLSCDCDYPEAELFYGFIHFYSKECARSRSRPTTS